MRIAISSESPIDLQKNLLEKFNIYIIPYTITIGDKVYFDGDLDNEELFLEAKKQESLPKTSAINVFQYENHFNNLLTKYDYVIHLTLSSRLSSAYNNCLIATGNIKNVKVIDTKSLSTGIALLAIYAAKLVNENKTVEEIINKVEARIPFVSASFVLTRVDYLYKGGRCSLLKLLGANILKLRPQIIMNDGIMVMGKKFRGGINKVIEKYVNQTLEENTNPDLSTCFITYTTIAKSTIDFVYNILKKRGFKEIYITKAGGTISSHCGEECFGILFINDGTKNE